MAHRARRWSLRPPGEDRARPPGRAAGRNECAAVSCFGESLSGPGFRACRVEPVDRTKLRKHRGSTDGSSRRNPAATASHQTTGPRDRACRIGTADRAKPREPQGSADRSSSFDPGAPPARPALETGGRLHPAPQGSRHGDHGGFSTREKKPCLSSLASTQTHKFVVGAIFISPPSSRSKRDQDVG